MLNTRPVIEYQEDSELGLRPGEWPVTLRHDGRLFSRDSLQTHNGELMSVRYYAQQTHQFSSPRLLEVLND